jgi:hypothetical protein
MLSLLQFNLPLISVALAIGLFTGWSMFHRPRPRNDERDAPRS